MTGYQLYGDLAEWWPLISPPADYEEEAEFAASLLATASVPVNEVLELGSGGGNNASYLKRHFSMTLVDLSEEMLAISRQLNPECEHIAGDMRALRLDREFDAVFVHDAVDYMLTESDLMRAIETALAHCRPGGVAVFVPDETAEIFEPATDYGGADDGDGRGARFLAWTTDPDPGDTEIVTEYVFMLREPGAGIRVAHETHRTGLFRRKTWLALLTEAGFDARRTVEETTEDRTPRDVFVAHRRFHFPPMEVR